MSDPVWYYAQGDSEKGPLTTAQIKALTAAGKIRRDDFVWKEGMESWAPARELPELFDPEITSGSPKPDAKANVKRKAARPVAEVTKMAASQPMGQLAIVIGLLVVLLSRGCDSLGDRYVTRLDSIAATSQRQFLSQWKRSRELLLEELRSYSDPEQPEAKRIRVQIQNLNEAMREKAAELESTEWSQKQSAARIARDSNLRWGFWREATFQAGTLVLAIGLLAFGLTSTGPERWICLVMLGAIVFGVYLSHPRQGPNPAATSQQVGPSL